MSVDLSLVSGTTQSGAPFTVGHAFKPGEIPAGQSVVAAGAASFQALAKNAWPDGSLKFAVLSGTANLTAATPLVLTLSAGAPGGGTALTTADLKATSVTAAIDAGAFGSVSWATTDWDSPAQTWASGPAMSSWVYRKPVGADTHLVAWLEVRLYAGGQVEVLPWIENGYVNIASPSNKSATYAFTLGGTQRVSVAIDLKHHQRTPLINGAALSYWLGTDPGVTPLHDRAYLQATELVPTYSATVSGSASIVTGQAATFAPLQAGGFVYSSDDMTSTSYQAPIGLLPEHDMLYFTAPLTARAALFASIQRNGYSAGRYGIHYRDENTNRPLRFSAWPTITIRSGQGFAHAGSSSTGTRTPVVTGGAPPSWDTAHSPTVGYMAYLLTGRCYFMEQVQFAATCNYLGNGSGGELRNGVQGLVQPCFGAWQVRAAAWMFRSLALALSATPDSDTNLRTEFQNSMQANIDHFYNVYVAQPNNPFGFIQNAAGYVTNQYGVLSAWQQDFVTASFGWSMCLGLPLAAGYQGKLSSFFQWTAKSIVGRISAFGAGGWPYINADPYVLSVSSAVLPDWLGGTGPWRADWAEVYSVAAATLAAASAPSAWLGTTDGTLCGEIMPGASSMWGNLLPAMAYAVRHGVPGATAGRNRILAASNYGALATQLNSIPVWSVTPASIGSGMGKTLVIDTTDLNAGMLTIGDTGHGVLGSVIRATTGTGADGAGVLYNDWDSGDDNSEFRAKVLTLPASGTLFVNENGSFSLIGAGPGSHSWTYQLYVDGAAVGGPTTVTVQIGATGSTNETVAGVTSNMSASVRPRATLTSTIARVTSSMSAQARPLASMGATLGGVQSSMSASVNGSSATVATLGGVASAMSAMVRPRATTTATAGRVLSSMQATGHVSGNPTASMNLTLARVMSSMSATGYSAGADAAAVWNYTLPNGMTAAATLLDIQARLIALGTKEQVAAAIWNHEQ